MSTMTDHLRQMRQEKPEAICPVSETERHVWMVRYDIQGRLVVPANSDGLRRCEACDCVIEQYGSRWVKVDDVRLDRWEQLPRLVIQEEMAIEDVL